jgi:hypothetical protein
MGSRAHIERKRWTEEWGSNVVELSQSWCGQERIVGQHSSLPVDLDKICKHCLRYKGNYERARTEQRGD